MNLSPELALTLVVQLITVGIFIGKINAFQKMTEFRFVQLERKQDKYNHMQERLAVVESSNKSAHHRIDNLVGERRE
ncbi:MAG: hypothetical protein J6C49_00340 [Elusimicrobiaceae bacterium]|uniref:hypothetical protein n=1 Tax=Candidatus Avelusimicrobium sp. TaxID=3048833 RepID=UPI001B2AD3EE|nr:hypothetical protein [Elusimicrobiaceae bacterium]